MIGGRTKKNIKNWTFNFETRGPIFNKFSWPDPLSNAPRRAIFTGHLGPAGALTDFWQIDFNWKNGSVRMYLTKVRTVELRPNNGSPERATLGHTRKYFERFELFD